MATFNVRSFGLQFAGYYKHFRRKKVKKTRRTDEEFSYLRKDVRKNLLRVFAKLYRLDTKTMKIQRKSRDKIEIRRIFVQLSLARYLKFFKSEA